MTDLKLPDDLTEFLATDRKLEYDPAEIEPGFVGLNSIDDLKPEVVWINSDESPLAKADPNFGSDGYYEVPAVSLTGECEAYDAEFILLWLPNEQVYGTWDCDHWDLFVFPGASWAQIVESPAKFIDTQWNTERDHAEYFKPFPTYSFKSGSPF